MSHPACSWASSWHLGQTEASMVLAALLLGLAVQAGYRLLLSPYRRVPGRLLYKLTPLTSQLRSLLGMLADDCEADYYEHGDIYTVGPGVVVISNPDDCRAVLNSPRFVKSEFYQAFALIEDNIYTTQSADLANMRRRQLRHALSLAHLETNEQTILDRGVCALMEELDQQIGKGSAPMCVQYEGAFMNVALDVMAALVFGRDGRDSLVRSRVIQWIHDYNRLSLINLIVPWAQRWPLSIPIRRLLASKAAFVAAVTDVAEKRRTQQMVGVQAPGDRPADILQALLDAQAPGTGSLSDSQVVAECIAIMIAGSDIVAQTLTWTLHYLLLHPEAHARVATEVRQAFPHQSAITHSNARARLPFLEACIYEAMRIRAATGVFLPRIVPVGGASFQGHFLPQGTQVCVNVAGANHHRQSWSTPFAFCPQRFIDDAAAKNRIFSFSFGPRMCPGKSLAMFEMLPVLANLLRNYDFALSPDAKFHSANTDSRGCPIAMPREHRFTCVGPKHPDRDCLVMVSPAAGRPASARQKR